MSFTTACIKAGCFFSHIFLDKKDELCYPLFINTHIYSYF